MAYTAQQYRASFLFDIAGTDEVAITDVSISGGSGDAVLPPPDTAAASALDGAMITLLGSTGLQRASYSRYLGVKLAWLDTDGDYLADPVTYETTTPLAGNTNFVVPQSTTVLSLRSGSSLGKGNYGRMYMPHCGVTGTNSPYLSTAHQSSLAQDAAAFISTINDYFGAVIPGRRVRIMSQAAGGPFDKPVTQVYVGRVIDTQRRRRNSLTEDYVVYPVL